MVGGLVVVVLQEIAHEDDMKIAEEDLAVSTWPEKYRVGGQHVGYPSGVKVEHLPTGTVAICQLERSQYRNRTLAVEMIEWALLNARA